MSETIVSLAAARGQSLPPYRNRLARYGADAWMLPPYQGYAAEILGIKSPDADASSAALALAGDVGGGE